MSLICGSAIRMLAKMRNYSPVWLSAAVCECLGRKDAALACGIHSRDVADMDQALLNFHWACTFVPADPDLALYNKLM